MIESILSFDSQSIALVYKSGFMYPAIVLSALSTRWRCPYFRALNILQVDFQLERDSTLLLCWLVLDQLHRQGYQFYVAGCGVMAMLIRDHGAPVSCLIDVVIL